MTILSPQWAPVLLLSLLGPLLLFRGRELRRRRAAELSGHSAAKGAGPGRGALCLFLGVLLCAAALLRPVSDPREESFELEGRNIVFLVDVSRSMLAEDLVPNRLDRARFDIKGAIPLLRGNRVALVAFAGNTVLKCPLTTDYSFFAQAVEDLSVHSVTRGGSSIGDALRFVLNRLQNDAEELDVLLITDGEDQETYPVEAAYKAGEKGIRIVSIAMGDQTAATPVPDASYRDEAVYSRPDTALLEKIAAASREGFSLSVGEGSLTLPAILKRLEGPRESTGRFRRVLYKEHYRWLLLPGALLTAYALFRRKRYGF